jgi:cellulose synthase/poly-beta-1,6-N-acetylglucosamine synthase-like glycosyltransferase
MILLPFYNESLDVVEEAITSLIKSDYNKKKFIVVLAGEERQKEHALSVQKIIEEKYADTFGHFISTIHPKDVPGEHAGKGSNTSYAIEIARTEILDRNNIPYENVIVSNFDTDTVAYPGYFSCLTWYFLESDNPYRTSFQPVPFYNNNIWHAPAFSRVAATSGSLWQMIQQERPEKLVTFSSHSVSFKTLHEIGYWQRNMVSEDSRIFWNAFMAYDGEYTVTPIAYPVSMDANLAPTFRQTIKNIYKQHRRWMWGAENIPYIIFNFIKNKKIPKKKKFDILRVQIDGYWSLATNPIFILLLGWLPLILGGINFNKTILSYNLPNLTQYLMTAAMVGIFISAIVAFKYLPKPPEGYGKLRQRIYMLIQWALVPVTIIIFGAIPGIEAQTRLMLGKYMGFWVTPKHRK